MRVAAPVIAAAIATFAPRAEAAITEGQDALIATLIGVGSVGAMVTTVAAIFYMVEGRAFHTPWVVASLFSAATCVSAAFGIAREAGDAAPLAVAVFALIPAAPLYWSVRSAFNPAGFGELLDAPPPKPPPPESLTNVVLPQPQLVAAFRF